MQFSVLRKCSADSSAFSKDFELIVLSRVFEISQHNSTWVCSQDIIIFINCTLFDFDTIQSNTYYECCAKWSANIILYRVRCKPRCMTDMTYF